MWLSDTSVKRPVFATVISLLLIAFGVLGVFLGPTLLAVGYSLLSEWTRAHADEIGVAATEAEKPGDG